MKNDREAILYAFAIEASHDRETLERYLRQYPELAGDLIDLASEIRLGEAFGPSPTSATADTGAEAARKDFLAAKAPEDQPMRVEVTIEEVNDIDGDRRGVRATCLRCDHETESFGTGPKSRVRCIMLMREECEMGESNYYVDADGNDDTGPPSDPVPKPWWEK